MSAPHPTDEELSAHLDGEAGPETAGHIAACESCGARLGDLRAIADAIGARPPIDDAWREQAITTALAAAPASNVVPLGPRRLPIQLLAAAAAVVVAILAVPLLTRTDDTTTTAAQDAAKAGDDAAAESSDAGDRALAAPAPAAGGSATESFAAAPAHLGDLGDLDGVDLAERIAAAERRPQTSTGTTPPGEACIGAASEEGIDGPIVATGTGRLDGQAVVVLVFEDPDGRQAVVLTAAACRFVRAEGLP